MPPPPRLDVEQELIKVVCSSELGRHIFGFAIEQVLNNMVKNSLQTEVQALLTKKKITVKEYAAAKKTALVNLQKRDGMENLPDKRDILIDYRATTFSIKVMNISEEVDFRFAAALKTLVVDNGELQALVCEDDLVGRRPKGAKGQVEKGVYMEWSAARDSCSNMLASKTCGEGDAIVSQLTKKESSLRAIDPTFLVEIRFFQSMAGEAGEQFLRDKVLALMPTAKTAISEAKVISSLKQLMASELYKFAGAGARGVVTTVSALVNDLLDGRAPSFASNPGEFLVDIRTRMAFFCRVQVPKKEEIVGAGAARFLCEQCLKSDAVDLATLEKPITFSWLLPDDLASRLEELRQQAVASASASIASLATPTGAKRGAPKASAEPTSKKSKGSANKELDAAMAMFKGIT